MSGAPTGSGPSEGSPATPEPGPSPSFGPSAILTPANVITIARLLIAPIAFWMIIQQESSWPLWVLWALLTTTDSLDGYLARRQGTTRSGAFLDPLADKVLSLGGLWAMVVQGRFWWLPVVLITLREVLISAFRSYWGRRGLAVQASQIAKFKTFLQFGAVGWVVFPLTTDITWLADSFLWAGVAVAWISAAQYVAAGSRATSTMSRD
jgi:CDP-diacylglycerol--glycerol-3-phosphate 3-phosphatidyltransferase